MKFIRIFIAGLCAFASFAQAGVVQLNLAPLYNIDGVANTGDATQSPLDQPNAGGNFVFATQSLAISRAGANGNGLLDSGYYAANVYSSGHAAGLWIEPERQ